MPVRTFGPIPTHSTSAADARRWLRRGPPPPAPRPLPLPRRRFRYHAAPTAAPRRTSSLQPSRAEPPLWPAVAVTPGSARPPRPHGRRARRLGRHHGTSVRRPAGDLMGTHAAPPTTDTAVPVTRGGRGRGGKRGASAEPKHVRVGTRHIRGEGGGWSRANRPRRARRVGRQHSRQRRTRAGRGKGVAAGDRPRPDHSRQQRGGAAPHREDRRHPSQRQ